MSYARVSVYTTNIASGASTASNVYFDKSYTKVYVQVPTMSTAAAFDIYASDLEVNTYYQAWERIKTAPVQYQSLTIGASIGVNGGIVPIEFGFRHIQLRCTAVVSGGVVLKIYCTD